MTDFHHDRLRAELRRIAGSAGRPGGLITAERAATLAHRQRRMRTRAVAAAIATALVAVGVTVGLVALTATSDSRGEQVPAPPVGDEVAIGETEFTTTHPGSPNPRVESSDPPFTVETRPADPELGTSYPFDLYTHCGIEFATFGGRNWQAATPRPEPDRIPGPDGVVSYTGYTAGMMLLVNEGLLRFTITDPEASDQGETVDFARLPETAPAQPLCA